MSINYQIINNGIIKYGNMKCPYCGYEFKEYVIYCSNCSTELKHEDYLNSIIDEFNEKYGSLNSEFTEIYYENINTEEIKECSNDYINKKISAEEFVIEYYKQKGYSSFFSENGYWFLLFLLIYREDKIWGHNLYSMLFWGTYAKDEYAINGANIKDYDEIFNSDFKNYIITTYFNRLISFHDFKEVNEIFNNGKIISDEYYNSSSYLFSIDELLSSVNHLKINQLKLIFERMNQDLKYYSKGFPDLIVYNDAEFFLVEVKSKEDTLSTKQKQCLKFLSEKVKIKVIVLTIDKSEKQIENIKKQLKNTKKIIRKDNAFIKPNSHYNKILLNPKTFSFRYNDDDKEYVFLKYDIKHSSGNEKVKQYLISCIRKYDEKTDKWESKNEIQSFFSFMENSNKKNRYEQARKIYSQNVFRDFRPTKKQLERNKKAKLLEENNDLEGAIKLYEQNVHEKTGSPTTYKQLCKIYGRTKDLFRIKEICDMAIPIFIYLNDKKNTLYFLELKFRILRTIEHELDRKYGYSSEYFKFVTIEENDYLYENCCVDDARIIHRKLDELESRADAGYYSLKTNFL